MRGDGLGAKVIRRITMAVSVWLVATPTVLFAQQTASGNSTAPPDSAAASVQLGDPGRPALQQRNPRYRVQRDDTISISFPLSPELDEEMVIVQPDGYINLRSAPSLHVQGMTVPEIEEAVKKDYAGILHDPIVSVDLVDFQKPYFIVWGQVGKPGQYDLRHEVTVSQAVAIAGGFAPTAKTQVFLFHRVSQAWVEVKELKLKDIVRGKNANEDAEVQPGDTIFVPEKFIAKFRKYVPYSLGTGTYVNPAL
jgi:polysaccharide biosynthesis/export protein